MSAKYCNQYCRIFVFIIVFITVLDAITVKDKFVQQAGAAAAAAGRDSGAIELKNVATVGGESVSKCLLHFAGCFSEKKATPKNGSVRCNFGSKTLLVALRNSCPGPRFHGLAQIFAARSMKNTTMFRAWNIGPGREMSGSSGFRNCCFRFRAPDKNKDFEVKTLHRKPHWLRAPIIEVSEGQEVQRLPRTGHLGKHFHILGKTPCPGTGAAH